jgi:hypothetical protein
MTDPTKEAKADTSVGDAVLRKMLSTPPKPHKDQVKKRPTKKAVRKKA